MVKKNALDKDYRFKHILGLLNLPYHGGHYALEHE